MITQSQIRQWLKQAKSNHTHMIVVCDTFDWIDYPVYVSEGTSPRSLADKLGSMQTPMECYDLSMDHENQLSERRAKHWGD